MIQNKPKLHQNAVCCPHMQSRDQSATIIHLRALSGNQFMLLIDLGSTHSFINKAFVERVAALNMAIPPVEVRVTNGERLTC